MTNQKTQMKNSAYIIIIIAVVLGTFIILFLNQNQDQIPENAPQNDNQGTSPLEGTSLDQDLSIEQNLVKDYINGNIADLTDRQPTLGGSFYLADMIFLSDNRTMITYEDGHSAYEALVEYNLNPKTMSIEQFKTLSSNGEVIIGNSPNPYAEAATRLLAEKHNLSFDSIEVDINEMTLYHAKGMATLGDTPGDVAGILLAFDDGEFKLIFDGNGDPDCNTIEEYKFPAFMAPHCF